MNKIAKSALFALCLVVMAASVARAQSRLSEEDFLRDLGGKSRGIFFDDDKPAAPKLTSGENRFLDDLARRQGGKTRGIEFSDSTVSRKSKRQKPQVKTSRAERKEIQVLIQKRKQLAIDVEINFAYNSARLTPSARYTLNELGKALIRLDKRIMISGHTDAKGSADYNLVLSERRAEAVKSYLVRRFGLKNSKLIAIGNGEEDLKDSAHPNSGINRRVQLVNMEG